MIAIGSNATDEVARNTLIPFARPVIAHEFKAAKLTQAATAQEGSGHDYA
jgi:hypothetical protein